MSLDVFVMLPYWLIGAVIFRISRFFDPKLTRVSWPPIARFIRFMVIVTVLRMLIGTPQLPFPPLTEYIKLMGVFWEDLVHVLPALIMTKLKIPNFFVYAFLFLSSVAFATGHLYLSPIWALITTIYPAISFHYGKKHGLGTVIICHILYDIVTVFTMSL